jgi:quercetin dioxygenase-like cupin family protein
MRSWIARAVALAPMLAAVGAVLGMARAEGVTVETIGPATPTETAIGQPLAYPAGTARIRAYRITLAPGAATSLHRHEVPIFAFVTAGTLEVDYGTRSTRRFAAGETFLEAVEWCHKGRAVGDAPAVLIAVYLEGGTLRDNVPCPE